MAQIFDSTDIAAPPRSARPAVHVLCPIQPFSPIFTHIDEKGPQCILRTFILLVRHLVLTSSVHSYQFCLWVSDILFLGTFDEINSSASIPVPLEFSHGILFFEIEKCILVIIDSQKMIFQESK